MRRLVLLVIVAAACLLCVCLSNCAYVGEIITIKTMELSS
jgi:purine-cytosine permease-like protein